MWVVSHMLMRSSITCSTKQNRTNTSKTNKYGANTHC